MEQWVQRFEKQPDKTQTRLVLGQSPLCSRPCLPVQAAGFPLSYKLAFLSMYSPCAFGYAGAISDRYWRINLLEGVWTSLGWRCIPVAPLGLCTLGEVCYYSCADEPSVGSAAWSGWRGRLPLLLSLDKMYLSSVGLRGFFWLLLVFCFFAR